MCIGLGPSVGLRHNRGMTRPSERDLDLLVEALRPLSHLVRPYFDGLERIPDSRPLLFVGNHTLYGVIDLPFLFTELWHRKRICIRGLGDHFHFKIPLWRDFLVRFGAVEGTPENCAQLMRQGESILVFPGGSREVFKRKGEQYRLMWKERLGFARLALAHRCTIVPFAAVGADDCYDIVFDGEELLATPFGRLALRMGIKPDMAAPISLGLFGSPLPRPERFYFSFGDPIVADGDAADLDAVRALRDRTHAAVRARLDHLLKVRAQDRDRPLTRRLLRAIVDLF